MFIFINQVKSVGVTLVQEQLIRTTQDSSTLSH